MPDAAIAGHTLTLGLRSRLISSRSHKKRIVDVGGWEWWSSRAHVSQINKSVAPPKGKKNSHGSV